MLGSARRGQVAGCIDSKKEVERFAVKTLYVRCHFVKFSNFSSILVMVFSSPFFLSLLYSFYFLSSVVYFSLFSSTLFSFFCSFSHFYLLLFMFFLQFFHD